MPKKREYWDYLRDIQESLEDISSFVKGYTYESFRTDKKTINAVVRSFEIIGEAVKKIPTDVRKKHKDIPWKEMAGMRDVLIHEYFGVDTKVIWKTIKNDLPEVALAIIKILQETKQEKLGKK